MSPCGGLERSFWRGGEEEGVQQRNSCGRQTVSQPAGGGSHTPIAPPTVGGGRPCWRAPLAVDFYGGTINKIISPVTKYCKSPPSLPPSAPASGTKKVEDGG